MSATLMLVTSPDGWVVESRFPGGMRGGAWLVRSATGVSAVLKWIDVDAADAFGVVEHARACGYPTPRWLDHGVTDEGSSWCVQEFVEGVPMGNLDVPGAELIVQLVSLQRTITPPTSRSWTAFGRDDELVHSDLNVQNILLRDGSVAGVIDFEEAGRGYAVVDLLSPAVNAVVWRSDPAAIEILHRYALESYEHAVIAVAASMVAGQVSDWYRHAMPQEYARIESAINSWRCAFESPGQS